MWRRKFRGGRRRRRCKTHTHTQCSSAAADIGSYQSFQTCSTEKWSFKLVLCFLFSSPIKTTCDFFSTRCFIGMKDQKQTAEARRREPKFRISLVCVGDIWISLQVFFHHSARLPLREVFIFSSLFRLPTHGPLEGDFKTLLLGLRQPGSSGKGVKLKGERTRSLSEIKVIECQMFSFQINTLTVRMFYRK